MKRRVPNTLLLLFVLIAATAQSQSTTGAKAKLFSSFPTKITCVQAELSKVFTTTVDENVSLAFSDNFLFSGVIISNVTKYSNLQTVIIKASFFDDAIFALSKITNADNSISYVGRIITKKYFDGYQLTKDELNNYQLIKIETDNVIQDCSQN